MFLKQNPFHQFIIEQILNIKFLTRIASDSFQASVTYSESHSQMRQLLGSLILGDHSGYLSPRRIILELVLGPIPCFDCFCDDRDRSLTSKAVALFCFFEDFADCYTLHQQPAIHQVCAVTGGPAAGYTCTCEPSTVTWTETSLLSPGKPQGLFLESGADKQQLNLEERCLSCNSTHTEVT